MNAKVVERALISPWMDTNTIGRTQHRFLQLPWKSRILERPETLISVHSNLRRTSGYRRLITVKSKSQETEPYLSDRCIYLVGMMGSGKTTVGKILSQVLGYPFVDCHSLVEQDVGGTSVADIFKLYGEDFFREKESEILRRVFTMPRAVVSTSGGVVMRPMTWRYMRKGISVWLDVPLDALAKRIAAVGTQSFPLLHGESIDVYTKALNHLSALFKERGEAYANARTRVSLECGS